jgi:hypothetical protein
VVCQTIKTGVECAFMTKSGCGFLGGTCQAIVEQCEGCGKVLEHSTGKYCMIYPNPSGKWSVGGCPQATHKKVVKEESTQKVNPLKASKRSAKK